MTIMASRYPPSTTGPTSSFKILMFGTILPNDLRKYFSQFGTVIKVHDYFVPDSSHNLCTHITFTVVEPLCKEHLIKCIRVQVSQHFGPIPPVQMPIVPVPKAITALKVSMINGKLTSEQLKERFSKYHLVEEEPTVRGCKPFYSIINFRSAKDAKEACFSEYGKDEGTVQILTRLYEPKERTPTIANASPVRIATPSEIEYPNTWQSQDPDCNCQLFEMNRTEEWDNVVGEFQKTIQHVGQISIKRVQNKKLWKDYVRKKQEMIDEGKPLNKKRLFHGSGETPPQSIYKSSKGFDFRHSHEGALWGRGAYFAVNAGYSNQYSYKLESGQRQIFLAFVLTGNSLLMSNSDRSLIKPPPLHPGSMECYDSVEGNSGGSDIFVVYDFGMSYPAYLITYTIVA